MHLNGLKVAEADPEKAKCDYKNATKDTKTKHKENKDAMFASMMRMMEANNDTKRQLELIKNGLDKCIKDH